MTDYPFVSVIMPCRNEADFIRKSLESILRMDYPGDKMEILVVDGESDDGTHGILSEMARGNFNVRILSNPKKITPAAMNIGVKEARGEIIIRTDAHSEYAADYIRVCVEKMASANAWCVGGTFLTKPANDSLMAKVIAFVLSSRFGVGHSFRTIKKPGFVDTVPFGCFKKEIFEKIGFYDERLARNQDNEFCGRIIRHGGKIFMSPEIKSIYYPKSTLSGFLAHARNSGMWNAFTNRLLPYTFKWRHFIPVMFFMGVIFCAGLATTGIFRHDAAIVLGGIAPVFLYFLLAAVYSSQICLKGNLDFLTVPLITAVFFLYHFNYGYGIFKGWFFIITGRWKNIVPQIQS